MENWITRFVATLCTAGAISLLWLFGVFVAHPWHEGRLLALNLTELQLIGVPLLTGSAVAWGGLHLFSISDQPANPRIYATIRAILIIAFIAAMIGGFAWTQAHVA